MALARLSSLVQRATQLTTTPFHSLAVSPQPHHFTAQSHLTTSFLPTSRQALQTHFFSTTSEKRNIQDHKRRLLAAKYELRRKLYKSLSKDPELSSEMRAKHRYKLSKLPRNSSFVRLRNRCVFTGRARGVYQFFRMSRLVFRDSANKGALMGVTKASW